MTALAWNSDLLSINFHGSNVLAVDSYHGNLVSMGTAIFSQKLFKIIFTTKQFILIFHDTFL
jgi:hypothetical protein